MRSVPVTRRTVLQLLGVTPAAAAANRRIWTQNGTNEDNTKWPMFGYDPQNTGATDASGALSNVEQEWSKDIDGSRHPSLAIFDGTVYAGGTNGLYALDATDGSTRWEYDHLPDTLTKYTGPAVDNKTVYSANSEGYYMAVDTVTGEEKWRTRVDWRSVRFRRPSFLPPSVANEHVYTVVATYGSRDWLYAFDAASGNSNSTRGELNTSLSAPAVDAGVMVYGSSDGSIVARYLTSESRDYAWSRSVEDDSVVSEAVETAPAIHRGTVFIGRRSGTLFALDRDSGETLWRFSEPGIITLSPAVADGTVIIAGPSKLYAVDTSSGEKEWETECNPQSPPVIADDVVYIAVDGQEDFGILAVEFETGDRITKLDVEQSYKAVVGDDRNPIRIAVTEGRLYGHSRFGNVFALSGDPQRPPKFEITSFEPNNGTATTGGTLDTRVTIENTGPQAGTQRVVYRIDGTTVEAREIELSAGASTTVEFVEVDNTDFLGEVSHLVETDDDTASGTLTFERPSDQSVENRPNDETAEPGNDRAADTASDNQSDGPGQADSSSADTDGAVGWGWVGGVLTAAGIGHHIKCRRSDSDNTADGTE